MKLSTAPLLVAALAVAMLGTLYATSSNRGAGVAPPKTTALQTVGATATDASKPAAPPVDLSSISPDQRRAFEAIIKEYLINNPEIMVEVQQAFEAKQEKLQAERTATALKELRGEIFRSTATPVSGNPNGDITIVEFFDYNCGYCKRAFVDLAKVIDGDKKLRVVLKELPMLSKGSEDAARVALAAKLQGKYWEFHSAMLTASGTATEASALRVAEKIPGIDMAKLKVDMVSDVVKKEIADTRQLANRMGVQGTPFFLVDDRLIPGAPEGLADMLAQQVADIRKSGGCKVC